MYNTVPDTTNVNPIFSSYNVRSANFNENMDEFVKADNELYIEEQKKKKPEEKRSLNSDAINGIPNMPEFLKEEHNEIYKMPEWLEKLNVCSPDEIEEWKKQGGMGIAEAWRKNHQWASFAPYVNTTRDAADAITVSVLLDRAKKGEELTYEQQEKLVDYLRDMKELQTRGFTFGGGTVNAILATIPYVEEFAIGVFTSEGGVGLASLAKTLSTIGAKKAARKAVQAALKEAAIKSAAPAAAKKTLSLSAAKKIYKDTVAKTTMSKALVNLGAKEALKETGKALPAAIGTSAKFGLTKMPHTFMGGIADKQIATGVYVTDLGDAVFTDSEHLATSIMKSFGESTFEALTETAGWTLSPVAGYFAKPLQKALPKKFFTGFEKLVSSRYGMPAADALRKYGYDGVIEEMGEEVLNRFLCQTFGINGLDEYNFDGFMNNVLYADNPSQWGQEALSFAAVGAGGHIVAGSGSRITDEWNKRQYKKNVAALTERANRYIQSPEQFYLDQGLIKIKGSQSLAEQKLRDIWTAQNVDEGLQNDVLRNMSETEIRSELKKAIEDETKDLTPEIATERIEKDLTQKFIDNKTFAREKDAKSVAALFATPLQKLSEVTGLSLEEVMEEEMPVIQREAEIAQRENGRYIQTDGRIEELFKELDNLPSDFNDENYINQLIEEIDILSKIRDGNLEESEYDKAKSLINALETAEYTELANELREIHYNQTGQLFQADKSEENLIEHFGMSSSELTDMVKADIENILTEYDVTEDEFKLEDIRVYGSYTTGKNKDTSDLDFIVQYTGSMREDDAFNMLHDEGLSIEDKDGREVVIDINPVNPEMSGTIEDHTGQRYFQKAASAGAEDNIEAAKKEWEEKKTNSKYFKKWFGKSKIVDENGNPRLVYHGSLWNFDTFGKSAEFDFSFNPRFAHDYASSKSFEQGLDREPVLYDVYLKVENPFDFRDEKQVDEFIEKIKNKDVRIFGTPTSGETLKNDIMGFNYENTVKRQEDFDKAEIGMAYSRDNENVEEHISSVARDKIVFKNKDYFVAAQELREPEYSYFSSREDRYQIRNKKEVYAELEKIAKDIDFKDTHKQKVIIQTEKVRAERAWDKDGKFYIKEDVQPYELEVTLLKIDNPKIAQKAGGYDNWFQLESMTIDGESFVEYIQNNGYDGYYKQEKGKLNISVFKPEQIKSVENKGTFEADNPNMYYQGAKSNYQEQLEEAKANIEFKKFVNKIYNNKLPKKEQSNLFTIGRTPAKLVEAGIPQDILAIGVKVINKARKNKNPDHNLSEETISEVYTALKNPIAVIETLPDVKEKDKNKKYAVILDLQADNGDFVMASIKINQENKGATINEIKTIHSREDYTPIIDNAFNEKRLLKVDREKIKDLLNSKIHTELISDGVASLIDKIYQENNNVKYYQAAYHGSPHKFEEFSTENIGSGEGNQAHGWGLYFAENKDVSESYRRTLANDKEFFYDGKPIPNEDYIEYIEVYQNPYGKQQRISFWEGLKTSFESGIKDIQEGKGEYTNATEKKKKEHLKIYKESLKDTKRKIKLINNIDASKITFTGGQLYKVDIPDIDEMLDEDKTFKEQPEKVQKALKTLSKKYSKDNKHLANAIKENLTGKDLYYTLTQSESVDYYEKNNAFQFNGEFKKRASQRLNELGVKGITYDGRQDGRCYVVFDDKAVKVLEKYYQEEPVQGNMFYDNEKARGIQKVKGAFVPAENLIELFKNADESTIIHEFAHWWLSRLEKYAQYNDELALDLAEVRKFVKNDGGKFTREQHEKFAVGFEAYIRNGSARSNRLKKIFEDFKNALIQIYDSIKQLVYTEDGTQYSFSEADVENLNKLFERLLTTENERIRKTVFDKCDDINERIKEIKAHQEEEMKELDELWKDNIAINNRKSDKKRKVQEYLEMADAASRKLPKEVKEMQKRYKDVTFAILEAATGYKRQFIANPRNWEKVQEKFEGTDNISASNGMLPEWTEFYTDTGVSYDNQEVNADESLAQQAYDVMVDGTYTFGMNEDEISEFYGKFDYLYSKVKTLKGEEKQNAWEALLSLYDNMPSMPDEVVVDLSKKIVESYEVYEEGQKEDFNRKHYPTIPVVQQLQFYVTNKLNELKIYDPNVKYKVRLSKSHSLYKAIKNATSVNSTKRIVRMINDYVISDLENQAKAILHKEIQKQIKVNSKLVKIGTLKKGKFDWKTNSVFAELAELNKLKQKEALKEYGAMIELDKVAAGEERDDNDENPVATPEFKTDFQSNLRSKFLEYRSNKLKDLNLLATRSLLEDIMTLKFEGRRAKDAEELEKQLQKDNMKTDLAYRVRLIKDNKAAQAVAKFIMGETPLTSERTLANWETSLNAIFGKEVAQRYSLLKLESDAEVYAYKHYSEFCQKAMDIYGLNNPINAKEKFVDKFNRFVDYGNIQPLVKLMQEYEEEVYNFKETTFSKETGQYIETGTLLSRAEIITLYAWSMNEELEQRITTQFGVYQTQYMFNEVLSDEDKQFAWLLIDTCEAMYDENNEVFIRTMGLSLPKVQNYFPSKTVRVGSEIDMLHENVVRSSNPSFIKQRKTCNRIKMKPEQPISILLPHINKTARYVILSERLNYLNAIFKDATVRAAIKEVFDGVEMPYALSGEKVKGKKSKQKRTVGDRIHDTLLNQLGSSTFENYVRGLNVGKTWADALAANYITSRIGGNAKVMFGQLTSVINYAEKMPLGLWSKGFAEAIKKPKETFKYMMDNCDYLKARLAGNSMNEIMSRITDETDRFRSLRNFCATNTKYGDILAICFGGKPYIDYLVSQGMNEGEAFDKFVEDTLRAQQSGHNSATSVWQKKMSENFFTRMMFAFNNTSLQYERKFLDAIAARTRGDIGNKELIKAVLLYKVFNPIIFTSFLGNLSLMQLIGALLRGDDDEDALARFGIDAASAMVFSNMGAYGFAGMGISTLMQFLKTLIDKKEYKPFLKTVPIIGDIEEIGKEIILKDEVTFADWVDAMSLIGDDATGVPVSRLTNTAGGVGDMAQGEYGVGALRMLGYGNYRANVAATGHPPEKKKRNKK